MIKRSDFPNDDDGEVLFRLAIEGVDLSSKRKIEFSCRANSLHAAERIVQDLRSYGYESTVFIDDGSNGTGSISVYAAIVMLPDHELLLAEQRRLNAILKFHETSCDGWMTASLN